MNPVNRIKLVTASGPAFYAERAAKFWNISRPGGCDLMHFKGTVKELVVELKLLAAEYGGVAGLFSEVDHGMDCVEWREYVPGKKWTVTA